MSSSQERRHVRLRREAPRGARRIVHIVPLLVLLTVAAKCPGSKPAAPAAAGARGATNTQRADSAEQVIYGGRMVLADRGMARGSLVAKVTRVRERGARLDLTGVEFTFFDSLGVAAGALKALEGTYSVKTSQLEARGKASVVRNDGRRLEAERIVYDHARSTITTDSAYVFSEANGARPVTGTRFESDARLRRLPRPPARPAARNAARPATRQPAAGR